MWSIYKITSPSGHGYVGVTKQKVTDRWNAHLRDAANSSQFALHCAIRKYGSDKFGIEVLTECVDEREAKVCERALIAAHGTFVRTGNGYNLTCGGDGNWGWRPSEETKAKIGAKSRERMAANPEYAKRMGAGRLGKKKAPFTQAHRDAMSRANKGRVMSPEWIERIRIAGIGRNQSAETIEKRMRKIRGRKMSEEAKEKMSAAKRGKKLSDEHRAKIAAAVRARPPMTPEMRVRMSQIRRQNRMAWLAIPENKAKLMANLKQYKIPKVA